MVCHVLTRLPLEILDTIIDFVELDADNDDDLISCSLTCHAFLPRCRKHLFEVIVITSAALLERFNGLIERSPRLAYHVRDLQIMSMPVQDLNKYPTLGFDSLMNLHILCIDIQTSSGDAIPWTQLEPLVQKSLLRLIHLPSLFNLELRGITDILLSDIAPCSNLKILVTSNNKLGDYSHSCFSHHITTPIKLKKLCLDSSSARSIAKFLPFAGSSMIFDMNELDTVVFECNEPMEQSDVQILQCAPQLKTVEINSDCITGLLNLDIAPLLASSDSLRFLNFRVAIYDIDPLPIIFKELESIANHDLNRIENLCFNLLIRWDLENRAFNEPVVKWDLFAKLFLLPREPTKRLHQWHALRKVKLVVYLDDPPEEVNNTSYYQRKFVSLMTYIKCFYYSEMDEHRLENGHHLDVDFSYYCSDADVFHTAIYSL